MTETAVATVEYEKGDKVRYLPTVAEVHKMLAAHNRGMTIEEAEAAILEQRPEWADPLERSRAWLALKNREREARREQSPALQLEGGLP